MPKIFAKRSPMNLLPLLALLAATPALAATPFEPLDLYKLSMVTAADVAPDGKRILFTRSFFDIASDTRQNEVWVATLAGDRLDRWLLIGAGAKASGAKWSPDGTRIAYIAPWLGKAQLWVMSVAEGVGRPVTSLKTGVDGFAWSPDGTRFALVSRVEAEPAKIKGMPDKPEGASWAPAPKIIRDFSYRSDSGGFGTPGADQLFVVASTGGAATQLTKGDFDQASGSDIAWTPDGTRILFAANLNPDRDLKARESDIYAVPAAGGPTVRLTQDEGTEEDPKLSPDGRTLAYVGSAETPKFYAQPDLWVKPIAGGPAKNLTRSLDRPIIGYEWAEDGRGFDIFYNDAGVTRIARLGLDGKARVVVREVGGTRLYLPSSGGAWSVAGGTYAYTTLYADRPAGLGVMRGGREVARIDFNADWSKTKTPSKIEEIRYTSPAGNLPIQGWIVYPPNFDPAKKYPLALEIHGGPNTDYGPMFSVTHSLYAAAGYIVLFTNPRGSIGYGEAFANAIDKAYPGEDYTDLMAGVDAMLARPYVDARNQFIGGGSGGGVLTTWAIGKTDRFRAASALRPVTDWTIQALTSDIQSVTARYWVPGNPWDNRDDYWKRSTISLVGNVKTPTILITGEADYRTPIAQTEAYYQALRFRGVDAAMVRLPEAGHTMGRPSQWLQSILVVVDWYDRYKVK